MNDVPMDQALAEIAAVFRCHPTMASVIADRIRERFGQPVTNADIVRVMKTIPQTRLSVETVVAKLEKQSQHKRRVKVADESGEPRTRKAAAASREKGTLKEQLEELLASNWKRAQANKLASPAMSVEEFVKAVRSFTGHKDAPLRRILNAAVALDHEDVVLSANVVADRVNELAEE
jgi:hypothetical protein